MIPPGGRLRLSVAFTGARRYVHLLCPAPVLNLLGRQARLSAAPVTSRIVRGLGLMTCVAKHLRVPDYQSPIGTHVDRDDMVHGVGLRKPVVPRQAALAQVAIENASSLRHAIPSCIVSALDRRATPRVADPPGVAGMRVAEPSARCVRAAGEVAGRLESCRHGHVLP